MLLVGTFNLEFCIQFKFWFWVKEALGCDLFSRVGACGRRPSESADPGGPASWGLYGRWYRLK